MAGNPLVPQGTLNRLRGSLVVPLYPQLNVTAAYLDRGGISLAFNDQASLRLRTMTGVVLSGEPYQECTVTVNLLKTQSLSQAWETQRQTNAAIGNVSITTDATSLSEYDLQNCSIITVRELSFNGEVQAYVLTIGGYYSVNQQLWDLV